MSDYTVGIWLMFYVVTTAFYTFGRNDERKSERTGLIALGVCNVIVFICLIAKTICTR